jgi:hypothetical protein
MLDESRLSESLGKGSFIGKAGKAKKGRELEVDLLPDRR